MRRIAFYMPDTFCWGDLTESLHIGGREYNVVRVAEELVRLGWQAQVLCPMPGVRTKNGVVYRPPETPRGTLDALVVLNGYDILETTKAARKVVWVPTGLPNLDRWREVVDHVVVSSPAKGEVLRNKNPWLDAERVTAIYSGTDPEEYHRMDVPRRDNRLLWCSSRERGLHYLLRWWPTLRRARPDLDLHITYDPRTFGAYRWERDRMAEIEREVEQGLGQEGVTDLGAVSRERLVREQKECTLWACPVEFRDGYETGSFTVVEMCAARTPMLLGEDPSLTELGGDVAYFLRYPVDDRQWIAAILGMLGDEKRRRAFEGRQAEVARQYTWAKTAREWDRLLTSVGQDPTTTNVAVGVT